jgi:taurine dioxygenase
VHPETGRKALYIGEKVKCLEGLTPEESQPIIDYLVRHATRPQFVYRHRWHTDDLLIWDNRCTCHLALGDYDPARRRHLERTTVLGTPSGYHVVPSRLEK